MTKITAPLIISALTNPFMPGYIQVSAYLAMADEEREWILF
jgi:hypothetical protein